MPAARAAGAVHETRLRGSGGPSEECEAWANFDGGPPPARNETTLCTLDYRFPSRLKYYHAPYETGPIRQSLSAMAPNDMTTHAKLEALAANLWWSWNPEVLDLFRRLNADAFVASGQNPKAALRATDPAAFQDERLAAVVDAAYDALRHYLDTPGRLADAPRTSYFCMEYGLHESLPIYAGGLGILAGDHTKAASDLGIPFTAIGLFLRDGYFRQHFDGSGWQQETYPALDPDLLPVTLVTDDDGRAVTVEVPLGPETVHLKAWRLDIGKTKLYLLDADVEATPPHLRDLTHKLYQGGVDGRIRQEVVLGIGGVRLLRALGVATDVYHMNEGHCAFLAFELLRERLQAGDSREEAEAWTREHCVFTTHTPVMAGHDRFSPHLFSDVMAPIADALGMDLHTLLAYGRVNPDDNAEAFTMTVLGLKLSRAANGVSALNGEVARAQWHHLYPHRSLDEVPIGAITNGVHLPTWTAPLGRAFLEQRLGNWLAERGNPDFWKQIDHISDGDLWAYRRSLRRTLIDFIHARVPQQSLPQAAHLNPDALTIGFARRFATYKRAPLLFHDLDRAIGFFADEKRPIQVIYAGKAHPADEGGKRFIQQIYEMSQHPALRGKLVFLENYDMEIGRMLVSGCDVWLNNPRRPMEASGTSGQKVATHGGLNLSILDGWWPEGFNGRNGFAIGHDASAEIQDPAIQDPQDALFLYQALEQEVIPAFYDRDADGLPHRWIAMMRTAMSTLAQQFSAVRMVEDYVTQMYRVEAMA